MAFRQSLTVRVLLLACIVSLGTAPWGPVLHAGGQLPAVSGTLTVASDPPGAEVFVDGERVGVTPLTIAPISTGEHRVRVGKDGFLDNSRVVNVRGGRTATHNVRLTSRGPAAANAAQAPQGLKIVVVEGEDLVNIIQQRTAVRTVVEVRDRNDNPVAGAAVLFRLGGNGATLNGGGTTFSMVTNAAGQATVSVTPAAGGAASGLNLSVTATFQGQTAAATVGSTGAVASSGGSSAGAGGSGGGTGAATSTGIAAGGGGVGGLSTLALTSIIAGGATAGIVTASVVGGNKAPTASAITTSAATGFVGVNSTISFSVTGSDPDNDTLNYTWAFGDGGTATGASVSHNYTAAGTYTVRVAVSDGEDQVETQTAVTIKALNGTWRSDPVTSVAGTLNMNFALTVSGTTITGNFTQGAGTGPITGTLSASAPHVTFSVSPSIPGQPPFPPFVFTGTLGGTLDTITGSLNGSGFNNQPMTIARQ